MLKILFYGFIIVFIVIQLFQPDHNVARNNNEVDIADHYKIPDTVEAIITKVCYDCHSYHTNYPWAINIQPFGWYIQSKIDKGKKHLNFSEFGSLPPEAAIKRLKEIDEAMQHNRMPLRAYKWYNKDSELTEEQRKMISDWAKQLQYEIASKNPMSNKMILPVEQ